MAGIMDVPIAETVAGPEPEIAAKNMQAKMVTMPSPPVISPIRLLAKSTIFLEIPPSDIKLPASIKKGMAKSGKESKAAKEYCVIMITGMLLVKYITIRVANPRATPIGILIEIKRISRTNNNTGSI
ncbi:hypothetical protein SDC9_100753 [bioreactor metagenome]|uniref:Uncharacterized protein n=1 Tax=bioreactor metagenome TaxID=1076179 RepID=A0A645ANV8_9ZZZZ